VAWLAQLPDHVESSLRELASLAWRLRCFDLAYRIAESEDMLDGQVQFPLR
jgi:hypothetical protein